MEIENPKMHCFGQRQWKLHQCTSKIRSSKNVVQNAFLSHFLYFSHFPDAFFTFFQDTFSIFSHFFIYFHNFVKNVKNVKKCILKMHREKNVKNVFRKFTWEKCGKTCFLMWVFFSKNAFGILRGKMPGQFLSLDFVWSKGSLLFGGPVPHKVWGRPGWLVWWWSHGHTDWFESRVPSECLLNVEKLFPNSSSSVFSFGSQPIWFVGGVRLSFYIIYLDLSISVYQLRQYLHFDSRWCMAVNQESYAHIGQEPKFNQTCVFLIVRICTHFSLFQFSPLFTFAITLFHMFFKMPEMWNTFSHFWHFFTFLIYHCF